MLNLICRMALVALAVSACCGLAVAEDPAEPAAASTPSKVLRAVRERGHVLCGVDDNAPGFAKVDKDGQWSGFNVDFCSALAAAVLGSKDAVVYRPLSSVERFRALTGGDIDVLVSSTGWTLSRDTELGVRFVSALFYNGQGFLVSREHAFTSVLELSGASICLKTDTNAKQGVADFFGPRKMRFQEIGYKQWDEVIRAFTTGGCTVLTGDVSTLALERSRFAEPDTYQILPELITKMPQGPAIRQGDEGWFAIVRWTMMAMLAAEELGVTSENVDNMRTTKRARIRHFLGLDSDLGKTLGLQADWAYQIVAQVGNYAQVFDRNLGGKSLFKLDRGLNGLWSAGGLMYAIPLR